LTPEGLFQIVAEEAFKDGVLEGWEAKILQILANFLDLPRERALAIAQSARQRHREGKLGQERPLRPEHLYRKVLYFTCYDGQIAESEGQMLLALRRLFKISEKDHTRLFQQVAMQFRRQSRLPSGEFSFASLPSQEGGWGAEAVQRATRMAQTLHSDTLPENAPQLASTLLQEIQQHLPEKEARRPLLKAFSILLPVLASLEMSKQATAFLIDTLQPQDLWSQHPDLYINLMQAWPSPILIKNDPDRLQGLVEILWGLARLSPTSGHRWKAMGFGLFQILKGLASQRDWERHQKVFRLFHQVPTEFLSEIAAPWAEAAADWVVLGLHSGLLYAVDRGLHQLKCLASYRDQAPVRRAESTALGCLLQACAEDPASEPSHLLKALERSRDLRRAFPEDLELLRPQVLGALDLSRALLALGRPIDCADLLQELAHATCHFGSAEELHFELAKTILATTHARLQQVPPPDCPTDPLLGTLKQVMANLQEHAPGTIVEAAGRKHQTMLANLGV
jgi:hypothetical protein